MVLRRGAKGEDVKRLQALLRSHGFPDLAADGDFGPATEVAVRHFQSERKLVVDGVAGPQTWAALTPGSPHTRDEPSGVGWVKRFPTSRSVKDLRNPFATDVKRFLAALAEAGASVTVNATLRLRIPLKSAGDSGLMSATHSD